MSDIMGGMPPRGTPSPGGSTPKDPISANRSIMNPVDMAAMGQQGTVKPGLTIRDYIEKVIKVPIDAPVEQLAEAIKRQGQNQSGIGKVGAMAQGGPPQMGQPPQRPPMPNRMQQGRPAAVPTPRPQQGLADLMNK